MPFSSHQRWTSVVKVNHILLTGAGFSRNWGGLLANEAFEYLLGSIHADDDLRQLLWAEKERRHEFEDTLAMLQDECEANGPGQAEQNLRNLNSALLAMFGDMKLAFSRMPFETADMVGGIGVKQFLAQFDAMFTLNQDTLLELHYIGKVDGSSFPMTPLGPAYRGAYRPGVVKAYDTLTYGSLAERIELYKANPDGFTQDLDQQPYFKLHGSSDFKASDRTVMLILGGRKADDIGKEPLLKWYHDELRHRLSIPGTRLMVIGYSFRDQHINDIIVSGIEHGLEIFIIDNDGAMAIGTHETGRLGTAKYQLMKRSIIGASRRPLLASLSGRDMVEFSKIDRFFRTGLVAITRHPTL
jgi:hypothetical protein